jgi:hypothetical protein
MEPERKSYIKSLNYVEMSQRFDECYQAI